MNYKHEFGGDWTNQKLEILKKYLNAYTTALKKQNFNRIYIDAFAGTGYRVPKTEKPEEDGALFTEIEEKEKQQYLEGSARIALQIQPSFDKYIFIEKKQKHYLDLGKLKIDFPDKNIEIYREEANKCLLNLCYNKIDWMANRAVIFLDPYGMQVKWETIKAIARTRAIDLWYLFPLGVGVNRLLKKDGKIEPVNREKLNQIFGTTNWYEAFYCKKSISTLFDFMEEVTEKRANFDSIAEYIVQRLKTVFPGVAKNPRLLYNSRSNPLYLFCFAAARPGKGSELAIKIAQHILKG